MDSCVVNARPGHCTSGLVEPLELLEAAKIELSRNEREGGTRFLWVLRIRKEENWVAFCLPKCSDATQDFRSTMSRSARGGGRGGGSSGRGGGQFATGSSLMGGLSFSEVVSNSKELPSAKLYPVSSTIKAMPCCFR